jgi:aryl-alcohol dehydrogenase-like predicted oxidoreductase
LQAVEALRPQVPSGWTMAQLALIPAVTCAIPGAKRPEQVEENIMAASLPPLPESTMERIHKIYYEYAPPYVHHYW